MMHLKIKILRYQKALVLKKGMAHSHAMRLFDSEKNAANMLEIYSGIERIKR